MGLVALVAVSLSTQQLVLLALTLVERMHCMLLLSGCSQPFHVLPCCFCIAVSPILLAAAISCQHQAYCFLGERWGPMGWCGAAVILIASLATQLGGALDDNDGSKPGGDGEKEAQATS